MSRLLPIDVVLVYMHTYSCICLHELVDLWMQQHAYQRQVCMQPNQGLKVCLHTIWAMNDLNCVQVPHSYDLHCALTISAQVKWLRNVWCSFIEGSEPGNDEWVSVKAELVPWANSRPTIPCYAGLWPSMVENLQCMDLEVLLHACWHMGLQYSFRRAPDPTKMRVWSFEVGTPLSPRE